MAGPDLLLFDEPFGVARALIDLHNAHGVSLVRVRHDQDDALEIAHETDALAGGRLCREDLSA